MKSFKPLLQQSTNPSIQVERRLGEDYGVAAGAGVAAPVSVGAGVPPPQAVKPAIKPRATAKLKIVLRINTPRKLI
jgi:hypothetical protein